MTFLDFFIFFVYTIIFYVIFLIARKKYTNPQLRKYHRNLFWLKVLGSFFYAIFVLYILKGDSTTLFFPEGYNFYRLILDDPTKMSLLWSSAKDFNESLLTSQDTMGYLKDSSNYTVVVFTAIFCFLTFGKYMAVNLFFAMVAFTGVWRLFLFFYNQFPTLHKQIAIAVLYLPTFIFWSSGILKDPLCIGALGWLTYALYNLFYSKENGIKNIFIVLVASYMLFLLKPYILVSYVPAFSLFLILKNVNLIKNKLAKAGLVLAFILGSIGAFIKLADTMQAAIGSFAKGGLTSSISQYQQNYARQENTADGSFFSLGVEFDGSATSLAKMAPAAIIATFFRPYIWESKKISTLLSSMESLALMILTLDVLRKVGLKKFFGTIAQKPIVLYCFIFSVVFALFVGATTLNFGTLVRYKIPAMPFYIMSLFFILFYNNKIKNNPYKNERVAEM